MKTWKLGAATIAAAAIATPSFAAGPPAEKPGNSQKGKQAQVAKGTTGATGATGAQGNAYGKLCKGVSKKKVKGQKGTPFSQCVKAMAKMDANPKLSPGQACKGVSKKKVAGQKGTPFSRCVVAAAKLKGQTGTTGATGATGATGPTA